MFITRDLSGEEWIVDTHANRAFQHDNEPYRATLTDGGDDTRFYRDLEFGGKKQRQELFWSPLPPAEQ